MLTLRDCYLKPFYSNMSLVQDIQKQAIDDLIQSSSKSIHKLVWIPCSQITNIEPTHIDNIYYATHKHKRKMLLCLGNSKACTPARVSEFAKIYSLPTHKYNKNDSQFRRYSKWLEERNRLIKGFTKYNDNYYYMVADRRFYHYYSLYGFCTACAILRCSPVWCICGNKQLSNGWTSNNKQLDDFIKKSQLQTNSPNHVYLEWIPLMKYTCMVYLLVIVHLLNLFHLR